MLLMVVSASSMVRYYSSPLGYTPSFAHTRDFMRGISLQSIHVGVLVQGSVLRIVCQFSVSRAFSPMGVIQLPRDLCGGLFVAFNASELGFHAGLLVALFGSLNPCIIRQQVAVFFRAPSGTFSREIVAWQCALNASPKFLT